MKRVYTIIITLFCMAAYTHAQTIILDSVYTKLDNAIKLSEEYTANKIKTINAHKQLLNQAANTNLKYDYSFQCYKDNRAFNNDSALHYLFYCLNLAIEMKRPDLESYCNTLIGHQYVVSGYFNEAVHYLNKVNPRILENENINTYYYYKNHLYRELAMYGYDKLLRKHYNSLAKQYLDSVFATLTPDNELYYQRRCISLFNNADYEEAMQVNDEWMSNCKIGTQRYANMAYYRSEIYRIRKNKDMQKYWLAIAAINELESAVMNQVALWNLAEILNKEGDVNRAFAYVECSWNSISQFSTHKRSWVVTPILTSISHNYRTKLAEVNKKVIWLLVLTSLLAVFLLFSLLVVLKERRIINSARGNLQKAYEELSTLNNKLSVLNTHLVDSNRVKDQYISNFFGTCSEYIEKLDNYRIKINRKLKANQIKDAIHLTNSEQLKEDELRILLEHFDKVFLNLFPTFVEEFNSLLKPEARITPKTNGSLNTTLRIFALIRIGINESSNIAEFLNYSPNSIYAYRARIKNGSINNRDDFENQVKKIGLNL